MQIHYAAKRNDCEAVQRQLARGIDIDARDENSAATPLIWAARSAIADVAMLEYLLQQGADVNAISSYFQHTALMEAVGSGSKSKVLFLLQNGADPHFCNKDGYNVLNQGCPPHLEITKLLLEHGVNPDQSSFSNESPLSVASRVCDWDTVRFLIAQGADPRPVQWTPLLNAIVMGSVDDIRAELDDLSSMVACDRWERSPLLLSICTGDVSRADLLLRTGGDVSETGHCGSTSLQYAVLSGSCDMLSRILSLGVDPNITDNFGNTALMEAVQKNSVESAKILIANGADVRSSNHIRSQAINQCQLSLAMAELLVSAGADINFDGGGDCPLKDAAENGDAITVRGLLRLGARVDTASTGETALLAAVAEDALDVIQILLEAGADPNVQDVDGEGALWYVRSLEATQMLLDAKIDLNLRDAHKRKANEVQRDDEIRAAMRQRRF